MTTTELAGCPPNAIALGQKLLKANQAARELHGEKYEEAILPWRQALKAIQGATQEDLAHTTLRAMQAARNAGEALMLSAAAVDLMLEEKICPAK